MSNKKQRKSIWSILTKPFRTKLYRLGSVDCEELDIRQICIFQSDSSFVIPMGVYPPYQSVDNYVKESRAPLLAIDLLISRALDRYGIDNYIVHSNADLDAADADLNTKANSYYIEYQDYWAWDFKKYMPVLKISLFDSTDKELITVISEGNTFGMHDYPNPIKQVPSLIALMMKQNRVE